MQEKLSQAIYLSEDEEITTIISKLAKVNFAKAFLVVPANALLLKSPINLRIIKEEAASRKIDLTIITTDECAAAICEKNGIKCSGNIFNEKKDNEITIKSGKPKILVLKKTPDNGGGFKGLKEEKGFFGRNRTRIFLTAVFFTVCAAIAFAGFFLPVANIFVSAKQEYFENIIEAELSAAAGEGDIPCKILEEENEFSQVFPATGEKIIRDYAQGEVVIFNEWDSLEHTFPAGTKIISENGKIFKLQNAAAVPGFARSGGKDIAGEARVSIKAENPGDDYNIDPQLFYMQSLKETEKYDKIYAKAESKIIGGRISSETVVSKEDIINANKVIEEKIKAGGDMLKAEEGQILIEGSIENQIKKLLFSFKEGDFTGSFEVKALVDVKALAVEDNALQEFAAAFLQNFNISNAEIVSFSKTVSGGEIGIKIKGENTGGIQLDEAKKLVMGKSGKKAEEILKNMNSIDKFSIKLWPFWADKIPASLSKVNIFLDRNNYFSIIN